MPALRQGLVWLGLMSGPFALALDTQLGYSLASFACGQTFAGVLPTALVSLLIALFGMALSWRELRVGAGADRGDDGAARSLGAQKFLAGVAVGSSALFALAILAQGGAGLVFDGCERW